MSDEKVVLGRRFVSDTIATRDGDGVWTIVMYIKEYRSLDGQTWEEKEVSAMAMDNDQDKAYDIAVTAVMGKFGEALEQGSGQSMFKEVEPVEVEKKED